MSVADVTFADEERMPLDKHADEPLFEVIDGLRVELLMSTQNVYLASRLMIRLGSQVESHKFGHLVCEMLFDLPLADRSRRRRPDVAFVSFDRWPENRPIPERGNHWSVVPDLAIEFIEPTDKVEETIDTLGDYFDAGVRQVWVIDPKSRVVQLFESIGDVRVFHEPDELDGNDILPGLRIPVAMMFPPRP